MSRLFLVQAELARITANDDETALQKAPPCGDGIGYSGQRHPRDSAHHQRPYRRQGGGSGLRCTDQQQAEPGGDQK